VLGTLAVAACSSAGGGTTTSGTDHCNLLIYCPCNDGTMQTIGCDESTTCDSACASHGGSSDGGISSPDGGDGG
jgi:hypothetical protein